MDPILTIYIPTFNRNDILKENLENLLPQLNNKVLLKIRDNASEIPIDKTLNDLVNRNPHVKIEKNEFNIGMSANILKGFETCRTLWLWILSDDDKVQEGSVNSILNHIENCNDSLYINYISDLIENKRQTSFSTIGINNFLLKNDSLSNIIFLSSGIYNSSKIKKYLRYGYMYSYSGCPHLAMLLTAINENNSKINFINESIVYRKNVNLSNQKDTWSQLFVKNAVSILYELPLNLHSEANKEFRNQLSNGVGGVSRVFSEIMAYKKFSKDRKLYFLKQLTFRKPKALNIFEILMYAFCFCLIYFKLFPETIERFNDKIRLKNGKEIELKDYMNRI